MKTRFLRSLSLFSLCGVLLGTLATEGQAAFYTHIRKYAVGTRVYVAGFGSDGWITLTRRGAYSIYADSPDLSNSTRTTNVHALRIAVDNTMDLIGHRINAVMSGQTMASTGDKVSLAVGNGGLAAGNMPMKWGVWAMAKYSRFDMSGKIAPDANGDAERYDSYKGNMWTASLGGDYQFNERFLLGLGFAFDYMDAKTKFNEGKRKDKNYTVTPYAAFTINKYLYIDALLGYSYVDKTTERLELVNFSGQVIKGNPKADRFFGAIYLNAHKMFNQILTHVSIGYRHMHEKQKAFNETANVNTSENVESLTNNLGEAVGRLKLGYRVNDFALPYVLAGIEYDIARSKGKDYGAGLQAPNTKRFGWTAGLGLDFNPTAQWSGTLEGTYQGRQDKMKIWTGMAKIRYQF